eukprot:3558285-Pyramimonas_sp.AAC.1
MPGRGRGAGGGNRGVRFSLPPPESTLRGNVVNGGDLPGALVLTDGTSFEPELRVAILQAVLDQTGSADASL